MKHRVIKSIIYSALFVFVYFNATSACSTETAPAPAAEIEVPAIVDVGTAVDVAEKEAAVTVPQAPAETKATSPGAYLHIDEKEALDNARKKQDLSKTSSHRIYHYMPDHSSSQGMESQLSDISKEVAGKVFYELKEDGEKNYSARVAVVAAVPLSDLKRETEFGRIMAEFLLTDLADRGLKVNELRLGKEINILAQTGEFILSRNIGELASVAPELDYVVVTTFTNTRKTLIIQGRLVSLQNGLVKTSWRYTMPLTRELLGLFYGNEQPFTIAVKGMTN